MLRGNERTPVDAALRRILYYRYARDDGVHRAISYAHDCSSSKNRIDNQWIDTRYPMVIFYMIHLGSEELGVGCHGVVVNLPRALVQAVRERLVERAHLTRKKKKKETRKRKKTGTKKRNKKNKSHGRGGEGVGRGRKGRKEGSGYRQAVTIRMSWQDSIVQ